MLILYASYAIPDAHAIYLLNLLLAFLQPKFDPSLQDDLLADEIEGGGEVEASPLPSQRDDEFRPFVRRLPEWQFWFVNHGCLPTVTMLTHDKGFPLPVPLLLLFSAQLLKFLTSPYTGQSLLFISLSFSLLLCAAKYSSCFSVFFVYRMLILALDI